jgi:hypothetical protein
MKSRTYIEHPQVVGKPVRRSLCVQIPSVREAGVTERRFTRERLADRNSCFEVRNSPTVSAIEPHNGRSWKRTYRRDRTGRSGGARTGLMTTRLNGSVSGWRVTPMRRAW